MFWGWDILGLGTFWDWDVLRLGTFWGLGCFGVGMLWGLGRVGAGTFCIGSFCSGMFCLGTFCRSTGKLLLFTYKMVIIHSNYVLCVWWVLFVTPDSSSRLPCCSMRVLSPPLLVVNSLSCSLPGGVGPPPTWVDPISLRVQAPSRFFVRYIVPELIRKISDHLCFWTAFGDSLWISGGLVQGGLHLRLNLLKLSAINLESLTVFPFSQRILYQFRCVLDACNNLLKTCSVFSGW